VQPSSQVDQRGGWPGRRPEPGTAAPSATQRPRVGQVPDRLLHQCTPACTRLNGRCAWLRRSLVRRSPTGACQRSRPLVVLRNPRFNRLTTSAPSSTSSSLTA
jgi:hypothetical protein